MTIRAGKKLAFYKYRNMAKFEYIADILNNNRLYCANVFKLNDPMEGMHLPYKEEQSEISPIYNIDDNTRICSFSAKINSILLWVHYADMFRGIAIEFVPLQKLVKVKYQKELFRYPGRAVPKKYLYATKLNIWKYEKEYRYITFDNDEYIYGKIESIILGHKVNKEFEKLVKDICKVKGIKVYKTSINYKLNIVEREEI